MALLSGCNNGDSDGSSNPVRSTSATLTCPKPQEGIVGCWVTEKCDRMTGNDGKTIDYWGSHRVLFAQDGKIEFLSQQFNNSSCAGQPNGAPVNEMVVVSYVEAQPEQDVSGVEASKLIVTSTFQDKQPFDTGVLYFISNNYRLCLSSAFKITHDAVSMTESSSSPIDFESCLVRVD